MKKIILSIAVLALALSSCEDFLTKEPPMDQVRRIGSVDLRGHLRSDGG